MYLSKGQMKEIFEQNGWDVYILKEHSGANEIPYCDIWANHRLKDKENKVEVTLHVAYDTEIFCESLLSTADKFHSVGETLVKLVRNNGGELPLVQAGDTRDAFADAIEDAFVTENMLRYLVDVTKVMVR